MKKIGSIFICVFVHSLLFVSLFHLGLFPGLVFFYRGFLYLGLVSGLLWISFIFAVPVSLIPRIAIVSTFFSMQTMFFTLVPVTLERSVSIFLLSYITEQGNQGVTSSQLEQELIHTYVQKHNAVGKRMVEQKQTGSIVEAEDSYRITSRGKAIMAIYTLIGRLFNIR